MCVEFETRREKMYEQKRNEGIKKKKESNVISFPFEGKTLKKYYKRILRFNLP